MFADNTHMIYSSNNINNIKLYFNEDLLNVSEWLSANRLTLNQTKTEFMLIGSHQRISTFNSEPALALNNILVKRVGYTKSLGMHIDQYLSWNVHIGNLGKKVASGIGALKQIVRPFSLIQPYFDYCSVVWNSCGTTLAGKIQKLQNRAARVLTSANYDTSTDILFKKLGWIDVQSQRKIAKGTLVYKALNGLAPDCLAQMFTERSRITYYTLRDTGDKLALPQARTNYLKDSFSYSGAVLWNFLPNEV